MWRMSWRHVSSPQPDVSLSHSIFGCFVSVTHLLVLWTSSSSTSGCWHFAYSHFHTGHSALNKGSIWFITKVAWIFLCMCSANERWHYSVMSSFIGWVHTQNDPWGCYSMLSCINCTCFYFLSFQGCIAEQGIRHTCGINDDNDYTPRAHGLSCARAHNHPPHNHPHNHPPHTHTHSHPHSHAHVPALLSPQTAHNQWQDQLTQQSHLPALPTNHFTTIPNGNFNNEGSTFSTASDSKVPLSAAPVDVSSALRLPAGQPGSVTTAYISTAYTHAGITHSQSSHALHNACPTTVGVDTGVPKSQSFTSGVGQTSAGVPGDQFIPTSPLPSLGPCPAAVSTHASNPPGQTQESSPPVSQPHDSPPQAVFVSHKVAPVQLSAFPQPMDTSVSSLGSLSTSGAGSLNTSAAGLVEVSSPEKEAAELTGDSGLSSAITTSSTSTLTLRSPTSNETSLTDSRHQKRRSLTGEYGPFMRLTLEFIWRNMWMYIICSYSLFATTEMALVIKILPCGGQKPVYPTYHQTSNISHTLVGNKIVDHSDVAWASPDGTGPTTSSFST